MFTSAMQLYSGLQNELYRAARAGDTELMKVLLERGATVDTTSAGRRYLQQALNSCDLELMTLLFRRGVKLHDPHMSVECLQMAAEDGDVQLLQLLLENGARAYVNDVIKDVDETTLHLATRGGHEEAVHVLLLHCADVTAITSTRRCTKQFEFYVDTNITCLHIAAEEGYATIVKELLDRRSEVNAVTGYGFTPLLLAAMENRLEVVRILLDHGAWISPATKFGETAHEMAENRNYVSISTLLEEHMLLILRETETPRMDYECEFVKYYIRKLKGKRKRGKHDAPTKYRRHLVQSPTPERDQEVPNDDVLSSDGSEADDSSSIASGDSRYTVDSTLRATYGALGTDSETDSGSYVTVDESFDDEEWFGLDQDGAEHNSQDDHQNFDTDPFCTENADPNESFREIHRQEDTSKMEDVENIFSTEKNVDSSLSQAESDKYEARYEQRKPDMSDFDVNTDVDDEKYPLSSEIKVRRSFPVTDYGEGQAMSDHGNGHLQHMYNIRDFENDEDVQRSSDGKTWRPAASGTHFGVAQGTSERKDMQLPDIVMKTNLESWRRDKNTVMEASAGPPTTDATSRNKDEEYEHKDSLNDSLNVSRHSMEERPIFDGSVEFRPGKRNKAVNRHSTGSIPSSKGVVFVRTPISPHTRRSRFTKSLSAEKADAHYPSYDAYSRHRSPSFERKWPAPRSPFERSSPRDNIDRSFNSFPSYESYMASPTEDIPAFSDENRDGLGLSQFSERTQGEPSAGKDEKERETSPIGSYAFGGASVFKRDTLPNENPPDFEHLRDNLSAGEVFSDENIVSKEQSENPAGILGDELFDRPAHAGVEASLAMGSINDEEEHDQDILGRPESPTQQTTRIYSDEGYNNGNNDDGFVEDSEKEIWDTDTGEWIKEKERFNEGTPLESERLVTRSDARSPESMYTNDQYVSNGSNIKDTDSLSKEQDTTEYDRPTISNHQTSYEKNGDYATNGAKTNVDQQQSFESPGKATIKLALLYMSRKYGSGDSSDEETRRVGDDTDIGHKSEDAKGTDKIILQPIAVTESSDGDYNSKVERKNDDAESDFRIKDLIRPGESTEQASNAKERKIRFNLPPEEDSPYLSRATVKETGGIQGHTARQEPEDIQVPEVSRTTTLKEQPADKDASLKPQANVQVEGGSPVIVTVIGDTEKPKDNVAPEAPKKKRRKKKKDAGEGGVDKPRRVRKSKVIPERPKLPVQEDNIVETVVPECSILNAPESRDSENVMRFEGQEQSQTKVIPDIQVQQGPTLPEMMPDPRTVKRPGRIPDNQVAGYRQPSEEDIVEAVSGTDQSQMINRIDEFIMASIATLETKYDTEDNPANQVQESVVEAPTTVVPEVPLTPERGRRGAPEVVPENVFEGAPEGAPQDAYEGVPRGAYEGVPRGAYHEGDTPVTQSAPEGVPESAREDMLEGAPEGEPQVVYEGAPQGAYEGEKPVTQSAPEGEVKKKKRKKKDGTKKLRRKKEKEHSASHPPEQEVQSTAVPSPSSDPQRKSVCVTNLDDILKEQHVPDLNVEEVKKNLEPVSPTEKAKSVRTFVVTFVERSPLSDQEQLQSPVGTTEEERSTNTSTDRIVSTTGPNPGTSPRGNTVSIQPITPQVQGLSPGDDVDYWSATGDEVSKERKASPPRMKIEYPVTETDSQLHDSRLEPSPKKTSRGAEERDLNAGIWLDRSNGSAGRFTWDEASNESPDGTAVSRTSAPNIHYLVNTSGVQYDVQPSFKQPDSTRPTIEILPAALPAPKIDLQPKRRRMGDTGKHPGQSPDKPESFRRTPGQTMTILPLPERERRFGSSPKQDMNVGPRESAKKARPMSVPDVYVLVQFDKGNVSNLGVLEKDDSANGRDSSTPNISRSSSSRENLQQSAKPEKSRRHRVKSLESLELQAKDKQPQRSLLPNPLPLSQVSSDSVDYSPYASASQEIEGNSGEHWRPRPAPRHTKSGRPTNTPTYYETPRSSKHGKTEPKSSSRRHRPTSREDKSDQRPLSMPEIKQPPPGQEQLPSGQYPFTGKNIEEGSGPRAAVNQPPAEFRPSPKPRPQRPKLPKSPLQGTTPNVSFSTEGPSTSESPRQRRQRPNSFPALPKETREERYTIPIQASRPHKASPKSVQYADVPRTTPPATRSGKIPHQMAPPTTPPGSQRPLVSDDFNKRLSDPTGNRPVHTHSRITPPDSRGKQQLPSPKPSYEETDIW